MSVVTLGSNIASLKAQRQLGKATADVRTVSERLASGLRINHASDDAAGLSIASSLNADRRVFEQGVRNLNDGISLLNVADGATEQLSNILIRLKELAEQSANGTYGVKQRKALDSEAQALSKEYFRIVQTTSFNGQSLFSPAFGQLRLQGGYGTNGGIQGSLGGAVGTGQLGNPSSHTETTLGHPSSNFALGDINGDGILDMVSAGAVSTVSLGRGDGTFQTMATFGVVAIALALTDFNNDGWLDVALDDGGDIFIRLGNGDGSFRSGITLLSGIGTYSIAAADFNGDGFVDLIRGAGVQEILLGKGDGTFDATITLPTPAFAPYAYATADLNGDGIIDLAIGGGGAGGQASIYLGRGDGTFGAATVYSAESSASYAITFGDLNNDGVLDLVTAGIGSGGKATVRLGRGDGSFGAATSYAMDESNSEAVALGDLNGDGFLDMVTTGVTSTDGGSVIVRFGNGNGTFGAATTYSVQGSFSDAVRLADTNGDGVLDVIAGGTNEIDILLNSTTGGIGPLLPFSLDSRANALQAMSQFDTALRKIGTQRGTIGALQSRVSTAITTLQTGVENYAAASSRITDADFAAESANLVRSKIIQFTSVAVLAQANAQPGLALRLLADID